MGKLKNILEKLENEIVYLENDLEEVVLKLLPGEKAKTFARTKGGREYEIDGTSNFVIDAISIGKEITEDQYKKY